MPRKKVRAEKVMVDGPPAVMESVERPQPAVKAVNKEKMDRPGWLKIIFIAAVILVIVCVGLTQQPGRVKLSCSASDVNCVEEASENIKKCRAADMEFTVEAADGGKMVLQESVTHFGSQCTFYEAVKDVTPSESLPAALGEHSKVCRIPSGVLESMPYITSMCQDFFFDYFIRYGAELGQGAIQCSGGENCMEKSLESIGKCESMRMVFAEPTASGYWTKYMAMAPAEDSCAVYFEIVNAVKMPLAYAPEQVGLNMTCYIPQSSIPAANLNASWCEGSLFDYITGQTGP